MQTILHSGSALRSIPPTGLPTAAHARAEVHQGFMRLADQSKFVTSCRDFTKRMSGFWANELPVSRVVFEDAVRSEPGSCRDRLVRSEDMGQIVHQRLAIGIAAKFYCDQPVVLERRAELEREIVEQRLFVHRDNDLTLQV